MALVSVIGSEGCLGRALCRLLAGEHDVRRVDVACPVPPPTDDTRFAVNVVGTFNVLQACLKEDVRRVVWASSTAAQSKRGIYSITKVIGEDLCDYYHEIHGFQIAMMRYGAFTSCDLVSYGQRLFTHGVDRRDCVDAAARAVRLLADGQPLFGRYMVMHDHPWSEEEHREFGRRWEQVLERSAPDAADLVRRYNIQMPESVSQHDLVQSLADLDFAPQYNFETFLVELRKKDADGVVSPDSPRWCFETGLPPVDSIVWPDQENDY